MAYTTIDDPSAYFHTQLYTGNNNTTQSITNNANSGDFQADWLWIKNRDNIEKHHLMDSSRGANKFLHSNETAVERTGSHASGHNDINSFSSNGFTITSNGSNDELNFGTRLYVAWQWKANGGTTSSNTDGTITSTVQANTTAGFSIVQYVGNGSSGATFGHGLGVAPELVILKNRDTARSWFVGHLSLGFNYITHLNQTTASDADSVYWNNTAPSSTVVTLGNNEGGNENTNNFVAYCFKQIQGYSKFGSYTGNGSLDGPFVYLGFKPAWVLIRQTSTAQNWILYDNKINPFNEAVTKLSPNLIDAEDSSTGNNDIDMLSNGFKVTEDNNDMNESGQNFIYMAFAESPFVSSEGVPTTAR